MTDRRVRIIIIEDHTMVLDAMTAALGHRDEVEIVDGASSYGAAVELIASRSADVIVADLQLGDGLGTDLVSHANRRNPPIPVLLISGIDDQHGVEAALSSGCSGFVGKSEGLDALVDAIVAVARGAAVFPAAMLSRMLVDRSAPQPTELSPRELEVLQLLASAYSIPEISERLHLSVHTIRNHVKQILAKLGAHSQLEAVVIAARAGQVEIA